MIYPNATGTDRDSQRQHTDTETSRSTGTEQQYRFQTGKKMKDVTAPAPTLKTGQVHARRQRANTPPYGRNITATCVLDSSSPFVVISLVSWREGTSARDPRRKALDERTRRTRSRVNRAHHAHEDGSEVRQEARETS